MCSKKTESLSTLNSPFFLTPANAQLSGEQRTGQAAALHRKTLYLTHSKTATR
ncbi:hypothetical protein VAE151_630817 [Vibrio aestuarianus]|nr:exported hypothetical protein [Vibrio aestuarianus subsp. francensis]CAH8230179.1 hypothetical protein VAE128_500809 [Vibrio aestuarianus]CAH8230281.1 hypothetical protein VAE055_420820 [Vibrio aestuarianus]CAH8230698.1 hypothetical protein VAE115_380294 [Vibrio aestuarianus]CAH8230777.1 hypothetical protein VAE130_600817 [Vibrio aestuarianus]